MLTPRIL